MTSLEKKKLQLELHRVEAARMGMEIQIEEMKEELVRLEGHIKTQEEKEIELKTKLEEKDKEN